MDKIDNTRNEIDVYDVVKRIEYLEDERDAHRDLDAKGAWDDVDEGRELSALTGLLNELKCKGDGDTQWRGDWYPSKLIRDSHFEDYTREQAVGNGAVPRGAGWPYAYIDWEKATRAFKLNYTSIKFNGVTYWY